MPFKKEQFPENLKLEKFTPLFVAGDNAELSKCREVYVLPCFFKTLEHLMRNCLYKYKYTGLKYSL